MKQGYESVVHELLTNIKRTCVRGRNAAQTESNMIATCDHIENLADEALSYMDAKQAHSPGTHFQCQHMWSSVGSDGYMECLWCRAKTKPPETTVSDRTQPLRPNDQIQRAP